MVRTTEPKAFISVHQQGHEDASIYPVQTRRRHMKHVSHFICIDFGDAG